MSVRRLPPAEPRPIGARALKSVGDTLRPFLPGATVLDLYAGHGRLGLMALDEGADSATFIERHGPTASTLARASARWKDRARIECGDALEFLRAAAREGLRWDILFADPPFPLWTPAFAGDLWAAAASCTDEGGIFLVKHPRRVVAFLPAVGFRLWKSVNFGESQLIYLRGSRGPAEEA